MTRLFRLCMFLPLLLWPPLSGAESESGNVARLEQQVHELVNNHRMTIGLAPLAYSEDIARIARRHSRDMANGYVGMGHEGADERGRVLARTITYKQFAENVAANSGETDSSAAQAAIAGWLTSPGHKANIEGNYTLSGIGIARSGTSFFFTQIFLSAARSSRSVTELPRSRNRTSEYGSSSEPDHNESAFRRRRADVPSYEEESDPRRRAGRKRVREGYVQDLDEGH